MTLSAAVATAAALAASKSLAETPLTVGSSGDSVWCTFRNFFSVTFILLEGVTVSPFESVSQSGAAVALHRGSNNNTIWLFAPSLPTISYLHRSK